MDLGMSWIALCGLLVWAGLPVTVTTATGESFQAELEAIGPDGVQLSGGQRPGRIALDALVRIDFGQAGEFTPPSLTVGLADGSRLKIESASIADGQATLALRGQDPLTVPLDRVAWLRFNKPSPAVDEAWLGMLDQRTPNDRLIIRRDGGVLDQIGGVVAAATPETVRFVVGENEVAAPVERLEGILFGGVTAAENRGLTLVDVYGSRWAVASFAGDDRSDALTLVRPDGQQRVMPLRLVEQLRFADSSYRLASTEPVEQSYQPLVDSVVDQELIDAWLGPRRDGGDLVMRSRSAVTYRLEPGFARLATEVSPDRSVTAGGGAMVRVKLDDTVVWEQQVVPGDDPRGLEIPIGDARRVTFEVDFGEGDGRGDAGDLIRLARPRLVQ
jgi:hypothetical protein